MDINTPLVWYGGKQRLVPTLLPLIPKHTTYIEPYFGGGSLFFAKHPSQVEIINDLNKEVSNFYKQIQLNFHSVGTRLMQIPYSRQSHKDALVVYSYPHLFDEIERASALYILANQSYSGTLSDFGTKKLGNCAQTFFKKTQNCFSGIALQRRLSNATIENDDALKIIERYDTKEALFYIDPPYVNSRMDPYIGTYSWEDYEALLSMLSEIQGKFILTSYPNLQLKEAIKTKNWNKMEVARNISTNPNKTSVKTEYIVTNFDIPNHQKMLELSGLFDTNQ